MQTPDAANISSVVLVRPGAQTHAFDMEQRLVGLSYTVGAGVLNVTSPPNGNIAPPGYYMLFILNSAGVPSVASFVRITAGNQAPTATITSPASNVTINPGGSVAFSGTGSDVDGTITAYSWTFTGGSPASSSQANAGNVTYSTPGTYTASFRVTDNGGLQSAPATRTVTVTDFSLSATPASRTVLPGGSTTYTATLNPGTGFTGTVNFSVTGLPSGATASFAPTSLTTSGSTTLSVATSGTTPPGTYPLTIRGTSGPLTRTVNVTLVVNGDFSISATPASITINRGGTAVYTVTITAGTGFSGTVAL
ncbi:MAG TPA: galactose oxidase-like domain-containing protein, partial [Vicinamibacterales bacterium]|nr:galactose oxidase-like domain-containing protein [Vicinamibacterales bacterium]